MISYAIVGHPKRAKQASELAHALDAEVAMDNGRGSNANHDAAWALYDPWAEWHVVVEDDAILTFGGFREQAAAALAAVPGDGMVSFYLGNSRPKPTEAPAAVRAAINVGAHWVWAESSYWGVALALPTRYITEMLAYVQRSTLPYDIRLGTWLRAKRLPCWHTVPSLVDHDDGPSLLWENAPARRAVLFGENDRWNSRFVTL